MTWFKVDDQLPDHRKVRKLGKDKLPALGLWTLCGAWAADTLSDGFVPEEIAWRYDPQEQYAERLIAVGLWEPAEQDGEAGYRFHDWSDHQPTRDQVQERRRADADRRARWRAARKTPEPQAPSREVSRRDALRDPTRESQPESRVGSVLPDPTRPDPSSSSSRRTPKAAISAELGVDEDDAETIWKHIQTERRPTAPSRYLNTLIANGDLPSIAEQILGTNTAQQSAFAERDRHDFETSPDDPTGMTCRHCPLPEPAVVHRHLRVAGE